MRITATASIPGRIDLSSSERLHEENPIERLPFRITIGPGESIVVDDKWYTLTSIQNSLGREWITISDYSQQTTFPEEISNASSTTTNFNLTKVEIWNRADYPQEAFEQFNANMDIIDANMGGGNAASTFIGLTDTPATYVGQGSKVVSVNVAENALEFSNAAASSDGKIAISATDVVQGYANTKILATGGISAYVSNVGGTETLTFTLYTAPSVSLSTTPTHGTKEYGNNVASVLLTATTVKNTNDITSVVFKRGAVTIHTVASPISGGGVETYNETNVVSTSTTFSVVIGDGTDTDTASRSFTYVYPYYYGVGAQGLSAAQVALLTKLVASKSNKTTTTSPSSEVYYFAYPSSYGSLTSILDTNGFETLSDYTKRTENITGLDASSQEYFIYEFNNLTTQTDFNNTYVY